jgi:hypothetical protein
MSDAQIIDDAKRYVELVTSGGWSDPDVKPIELLADVLNAYDVAITVERDDAAEHAHDDAEAECEIRLKEAFTKLGIPYDPDHEFPELIESLLAIAPRLEAERASIEMIEELGNSLEIADRKITHRDETIVWLGIDLERCHKRIMKDAKRILELTLPPKPRKKARKKALPKSKGKRRGVSPRR